MVEPMYQKLKDKGFEMVLVVEYTPTFQPGNAAYCKEVKEAYGLTMPVLFDSAKKMGPAIGVTGWLVDWSIILDEGAKLLLIQQSAPTQNVEAIIQSELL